jgi:MarR family transcriptional repressor of emrRAB
MMQERIEAVEASLAGLRGRLPDTPVETVLILRLILFLAHEISQMLESQIRPVGLGEGEFRVLAALFARPVGMAHPSDLCAHATQSPANMSRICDALVERELITRLPSDLDRRKTVLQITPKGEELVRGLLPSMFLHLREVGERHSLQDRTQLIDQLKRLAASIDTLKHGVPEGPAS